MNRKSCRFSQFGFSLLEVLIALVITAIGLMGFAVMMLNTLQNNRLAMERGIATFYAYEIIDCMRANKVGLSNGNYTINFGASPSGSSVASSDLTLWKSELAKLLPSGDGQISFSGSTVTVQIQWDGASQPWTTESTL
ncbi:MAG TPA: type IV pilus modification protein PilV [Candidatus Competibacteraceae bacterium]|nr:MAG: type IV pilus modification protein PilV [Candidatus Competibacteraceae bacterium]HQD55820.1 type IV pilus modification protein PilV [Candidatus Competibacteraceae bacterium]